MPRGTPSAPARKAGKRSREAKRLRWKRGDPLKMPEGRHRCRPKSNPPRNLEEEGRATRPLKLAIPEMESSPKDAPAPVGKIEDGGWGALFRD